MFLLKKSIFLDILFYFLGSIIFAAAINIFTAPSSIAPGGVTGLATMVNYLTGLPIGLLMFAFNIPLFIWGSIQNGIKNMTKTLAGTVATSLAVDLTSPIFPVYTGDMFLITIFGGLLSGLGLALIFLRGGTTGGTDLAASLLMKKFPQMSMGRLILLIDMVIVVLSALVFKSFELPLYAAIVIFITSKIIDTVLCGLNTGSGKLLFVISKNNSEIADKIMSQMRRGITKLPSTGGYTSSKGNVLMCALLRSEIAEAYRIIYETDKNAFTITADAGEIFGEGFVNR